MYLYQRLDYVSALSSIHYELTRTEAPAVHCISISCSDNPTETDSAKLLLNGKMGRLGPTRQNHVIITVSSSSSSSSSSSCSSSSVWVIFGGSQYQFKVPTARYHHLLYRNTSRQVYQKTKNNNNILLN